MDTTHTLDLARLRTLENIKVGLRGSQVSLFEAVQEMEKKRETLVQKLKRAREIAGNASFPRPINPDALSGDIPGNWAKEVKRLEMEISELDEKKKALSAEHDEVYERFNEASHLFDACKKFADGILHDNSGEND